MNTKSQRNKSKFLLDHGVNPTRYDSRRGEYVPAYTPVGQNKVTLQRIKVNRSGYSSDGVYYGVGAPVFFAVDDTGYFLITFRARDRADAKRKLVSEFPDMKFYR